MKRNTWIGVFVGVLASVISVAAMWMPERACLRTNYAVVESVKMDALADRLNYVEEQCGVIIAVDAEVVNGTAFVMLVYRLPMQE